MGGSGAAGATAPAAAAAGTHMPTPAPPPPQQPAPQPRGRAPATMRVYVVVAVGLTVASLGLLAGVLGGYIGGSSGGDGDAFVHGVIQRTAIIPVAACHAPPTRQPCVSIAPHVLAAALALVDARQNGSVPVGADAAARVPPLATTAPSLVRSPPPAPLPRSPPAPTPLPWVPIGVDYRGRAMSLLYVDRANKFVHCNLRKNACSSWLQFMYRMAHPGTPMVDMYHIHWPEVSELVRLEDLTAGEAEAIVNDPAYLFFGTVRDPVDRFASAYLDKCYRADQQVEQQWCGVPVRQGDLSTVDAVIGHIERQQPYLVDHHFQQQNLMCGMRMLRDRFTLFRFDHLYDDARAFAANTSRMPAAVRRRWYDALEEVFVNGERQWRDPQLAATPADILTPDRVRWLARVYMNDYRFFAGLLPTPDPNAPRS